MSRSWVSVLIVAIATAGIVWLLLVTKSSRHEFDCTMLVGGWHPDVPQTVRDGCKSPNKMT